MKTTFRSAAWFLAGALLGGVTVATAQAASDKAREELHETYALAADGSISLDNENGSVRITTWDRAEVKLDAIKSAKSQADLDDVEIEIKTNSTRVRIHTIYQERGFFKPHNSTEVKYELTVPATARLKGINTINGEIEIEGARGEVKAATVNGNIKAKGLASKAELATVNGNVKATVDSLAVVKLVSATTVNGSVEVNLPASANADVSASTVNGGIHGDVPVKKNWPVGASVDSKLGTGGTKVTANTVNGEVTIRVAKPSP